MKTLKVPERQEDVAALMLDEITKRRDWTHYDLAEKLGVSRSTATRLVNGQTPVTFVQLWMLLDENEWDELLMAMDEYAAQQAHDAAEELSAGLEEGG